MRLWALCLTDAQHRTSILRSSLSSASPIASGPALGCPPTPPSVSLFRSEATSCLRFAMMAVYCSIAALTLSTLRSIFIWMFFARLAYLSVLMVSSREMIEGPTLAIIVVLQLPPSESLSSRVSLLSRYGMC